MVNLAGGRLQMTTLLSMNADRKLTFPQKTFLHHNVLLKVKPTELSLSLIFHHLTIPLFQD
jgi:hypothetical protein